MPRLARVRFVNIGHPSARMDDFTIDLRDANGKATDTTLWLRNGGGKSSILNLLFALVRPDKREFLGAKAEAKKRRLDDYIQRDDHSVVVCEWELDASAGSLDFGEAGERFLTGVFYEWRTGAAEEDRLRRLFFSARCTADDPRLDISGIPLFSEASDGKRSRRTFAGFRAEWLVLRDAYPHLEIAATENQHEWTDTLENAGIDPELFGYQIRMNQREGAVDDLFRFDEHEKFVDFLLELALDPALGAQVGRNIAEYRTQLSARKNQLLPEREMAAGFSERLLPIEQIAGERRELERRAARLRGAFERLRGRLAERLAAVRAEESTWSGKRDEALRLAIEAGAEASAQGRLAAGLRRFSAQVRYERAVSDAARESAAQKEAWREVQIWDAAAPLCSALRHEARARQYQEQLDRNEREYEPLLAELRAAAAAYAGAVGHRLTSLRQAAERSREAKRSARESARANRGYQAEWAARSASAEAAAGRVRELLEAAAKEREELVRRRAIRGEESGAAATDRLGQEIAELERRSAALAAEAEAADRGVSESTAEAAHAGAESRAAAEREKAERRRLDEAAEARRKLEQDPMLRAVLELEELDLERLPERALQTIKDTAHAVLENIIGVKMEQAEDERAVSYLEQNGLLPPGRDTQKILAALGARLPAAWAGWTWIEANAAETERQAVVERNPALATGVVVRDADFDAACEILSKEDVAPEMPVTIAPASAFEAEQSYRGKVLGPASSAFYNRGAARDEQARRTARMESAELKLRQNQERRHALEALANRLHEFRARYPRGWFAEQNARVARESENAAMWEERARQASAEAARLQERVRAIGRHKKDAESEAAQLRSSREHVERYVRRHEEHIERLRAELAAFERERAAAEAERTKCGAEADSLEEAAERHAEEARRAGLDGRTLELEIEQIAYLDSVVEDRPGPSPELRDRYLQLRAEYEKKIGAREILELRDSARAEAAAERARFNEALSAGVDEEAVLTALDSLGPALDVDARRRRAQTEHQKAFGRHGQAVQAETAAKTELDQALRACAELGDVKDARSRTLDEADELRAAALARQGESQREQARLEIEARAAESKRASCAVASGGLAKDLERTDDIRSDYEGILAGAEPAEAEDWTPPADDDFGPSIGELKAGLRELQEGGKDLDTRREAAALVVRRWTQRPEWPKTAFAARFASAADSEMEANAARWRQELQLRIDTIDAQLKDMNRHRDVLVDEALAAAEEALTLLRAAQTQSKLPEHVPGLGGAQFLSIRHHAPDESGERRGRIGALIDDLVDAGEIPPGLSLVQLALRRLASPIRVKVLHPDPDLGRHAVDIVDLARFSGGEQLTAAILLYCSIAQLRAHTLGRGRRPAGVLILDNPIGRASRARFLELQREVARAMAIQLFYPTGVNDFEALRILPNVVRVRNARIDRRTGYHVLEHDAATDLEAARIVNTESKTQ